MRHLQFIVVLAVLGLASAAQAGAVRIADSTQVTPPPPEAAAPPPYQPVQFPMPPDTTMNSGDTNVVGTNDRWFGTLGLSSSRGMDEVHQYYDVALPSDGWAPLSALMTSDRVVLQYVNKRLSRACIVTLEPKSLWRGTDIQIVVSPLINGAAQ